VLNFFYAVFAALLGILAGWLLRALKRNAPDTRVESELREQRAALDAELQKIRGELAASQSARAASDAAQTGAENALAELKRIHQELLSANNRMTVELASASSQLESERQSLAELRAAHEKMSAEKNESDKAVLDLKQRNGELTAENAFLKERLASERQQIETLQEKIRKDFEAISNKLLVDNSSRFNQQSVQSLEKLLSPFRDTLGEFKTSLEGARRETATNSALLKDQVSRVGAEAANLVKALKGDVKMLGTWGENMLDQILEKSGLQQDLHYRRQRSARDGEGDLKYLDVIVFLPEGRNLIIDSKVSLRCYEESVNCTDDSQRILHLDRHAACIRSHFKSLGGKRYQDLHAINAPDFVLMYVPIEAAFFAGIAHEPSLFGEALDANVVLTTNSTLLATLRTVAHVWRLADQQKNAQEIADRGGKLYDKFVGFIEDLQDVGSAVAKSQKAWESASAKLHTGAGNLVRQAEQLKSLGAKSAKTIPLSLLEKAEEPSENPPLQLRAEGIGK
jgi:DNA recombination protein RmuC